MSGTKFKICRQQSKHTDMQQGTAIAVTAHCFRIANINPKKTHPQICGMVPIVSWKHSWNYSEIEVCHHCYLLATGPTVQGCLLSSVRHVAPTNPSNSN